MILAVCSKNDLHIAEAAFAHPEMALKRSDVAAFVANWEDKAGNLRRIASMLDIGPDSRYSSTTTPPNATSCAASCRKSLCRNCPTTRADYPARIAAAGYFSCVLYLRRRRAWPQLCA